MNKRYIDFVPAQKKPPLRGGSSGSVKRDVAGKKVNDTNVAINIGKEGVKKAAEKKAIRKTVTRTEKIQTNRASEVPIEKLFGEKPKKAGVSSGLKEPKYGVIEDYKPKFVQANIEKRPLGAKKQVARNMGTVNKPASTVGGSSVAGKSSAAGGSSVASRSSTASRSSAVKTAASKRMAQPASVKFVNTEKIEKRPLSAKNVYTKKMTTTTHREPEKPVRIIDKPEKDSKAGLVIAIIMTIILGAAAGTVAFLLLPK